MQPDWLKRITYGLSWGDRFVVLIEGKQCAVVKSPGNAWFDGEGRHYGKVSYDLVRKDAREAIGAIEGKTLQEGGRVGKAKLTEWKKLVEECDLLPVR